jgi:hypothetical protein
MIRAFPIVLLSLLTAAACDDAERTPLAQLPLRSATPELRIGSVDDAETALTAVRDMAVDDAGRIITAHPQEHSILVHDAAGERIARLGGEGEGPGEFQRLGTIGLVGDTLWAFDYGLYRITYFSVGHGTAGATGVEDASAGAGTHDVGDVLRTVTVPIELGRDPAASPPRPRGALPDGRLYGSSPAWSREIARGTITETAVVAMDTTGAVTDTLYEQPVSVWVIQDPNSDRPGFGSYRPQPWADEPLFRIAPRAAAYVVVDRRVRAEPGPSYQVSRLTFDGDTLFSRSFPYDPVPVDPAAADSLIDSWVSRLVESGYRGAPGARQAEEWARADLFVPAHTPPVRQLVVGRDGTIWLRLVEPAPRGAAATGGAAGGTAREDAVGTAGDPAADTAREDDADAAHWLVLDRDGRPLARVVLPRGLSVRVADRDRVWGTEFDELDVPYIVRYGVETVEGGVE